MLSHSQLRVIHEGARLVGLIDKVGDQRYRLLLRNVGGVASSKDLDNQSYEDVMAVLEGMGYASHPEGPTYWQTKAARRSIACGERMARKIYALAAEQRYDLSAMARKQSAGRTDQVEQLLPREAWMLIEAFKAIGARESKRQTAQGSGTAPEACKEDAAVRMPEAAKEGGSFYDVTRALVDEEIPF